MSFFLWTWLKTIQSPFVVNASEEPDNLYKTKTIQCPSFDEEPWKSRAEKVRPAVIDEFIRADATEWQRLSGIPLDPSHAYVKLVNKFLDSIPEECWIDEQNEQD